MFPHATGLLRPVLAQISCLHSLTILSLGVLLSRVSEELHVSEWPRENTGMTPRYAEGIRKAKAQMELYISRDVEKRKKSKKEFYRYIG